METPFNIGDTYYLPHHNPMQVSKPCPVCYGNLKVTMILGNGEYVDVQCEACGTGYEGPRGSVMTYSYEPFVSKFTIAGVHSMYNGEWTLKSTGGETANLSQLYVIEHDALVAAIEMMEKCLDDNMRHSCARTQIQRQKMTWTVAYHEKCIKEWEEKIAWHRKKVSERRKP